MTNLNEKTIACHTGQVIQIVIPPCSGTTNLTFRIEGCKKLLLTITSENTETVNSTSVVDDADSEIIPDSDPPPSLLSSPHGNPNITAMRTTNEPESIPNSPRAIPSTPTSSEGIIMSTQQINQLLEIRESQLMAMRTPSPMRDFLNMFEPHVSPSPVRVQNKNVGRPLVESDSETESETESERLSRMPFLKRRKLEGSNN